MINPPIDARGAEVHLTVTKIDITAIYVPGTLVLDITGAAHHVHDQATAWAEVRGYPRLIAALQWFFTQPPPPEGYAALINKPHSVMIVATWPWAPAQLPPGF